MRIAIVGSGISGLVCAHLLHGEHDLTIFEANGYIGGHTNTVDVDAEDGQHAVDTGFIVFNDWTYPNFIKLIDQLGVESQTSDMSFSVRNEMNGLEYNGTNLNGLFSQRMNALRPSFHRMIFDILRFNKEATRLASNGVGKEAMTLGEFVAHENFSPEFLEHYLIPIGSSIWSANPQHFDQMPAKYLAGFLRNHGMLSVNDRPKWRVIKGGSSRYVDKIIRPFEDRIRLKTPVQKIRRAEDGVWISSARGEERFDRVIIAAHSDQALRMLEDPTDAEREVLGAIPYQPNRTVLHTDARMMPKLRRSWAAWNYHVTSPERKTAAITYNMNILQSLRTEQTYCVTLNRENEIDPTRRLRAFDYDHPIYTPAGTRAQQRWEEVNGVRDTFFCGAYWGYGFHEDGVKSALRVCHAFGKEL
ncbi:FAD-dependent oxidoreductase [bacterium]|nr:FAD-dependent oxidoreductase [bacterium]